MDRALRLIIEVQSQRYHSSWANRRADAERIRRLEAEGYTVLVVWDHEIWHDGDVVVERLMRVRRALLGIGG
jgi:very-short-patch-repair endonuclease